MSFGNIHSFQGGNLHSGLPADTHPPHKLPDFSWLEVYTPSPSSKLYFRARIGDGVIAPTGGGAGWEAVQRPQKRALTAWRGPSDAYQIPIPLIFDGWADGAYGSSVEAEVRQLEIMAGINVPGDPRPPLLILNAMGAVRHDIYHDPSNRWIIPTEPTWGEAMRRVTDGALVRQLVTVTFMLWTPDDSITRVKSKKHQTNQYVTAKPGDTYNRIAARYLKDVGGMRWGNRLAQLNGARDGASKPRVGQQVKLPTPAQVEDWKRKPRR